MIIHNRNGVPSKKALLTRTCEARVFGLSAFCNKNYTTSTRGRHHLRTRVRSLRAAEKRACCQNVESGARNRDNADGSREVVVPVDVFAWFVRLCL